MTLSLPSGWKVVRNFNGPIADQSAVRAKNHGAHTYFASYNVQTTSGCYKCDVYIHPCLTDNRRTSFLVLNDVSFNSYSHDEIERVALEGGSRPCATRFAERAYRDEWWQFLSNVH